MSTISLSHAQLETIHGLGGKIPWGTLLQWLLKAAPVVFQLIPVLQKGGLNWQQIIPVAEVAAVAFAGGTPIATILAWAPVAIAAALAGQPLPPVQ